MTHDPKQEARIEAIVEKIMFDAFNTRGRLRSAILRSNIVSSLRHFSSSARAEWDEERRAYKELCETIIKDRVQVAREQALEEVESEVDKMSFGKDYKDCPAAWVTNCCKKLKEAICALKERKP